MLRIIRLNKHKLMRTVLVWLSSLIFILLMPVLTRAANDVDIALLLKKVGRVLVQRAASDDWSGTEVGMLFNSGDMVFAGKNSLAAVMFTDDKSLVKVRDNSSFLIKGKRENGTILKRIQVLLGQIWFKAVNMKSELIIETPSGVATIKGTEFYCRIERNGATYIFVIDGTVSFENALGKILIKRGETGYATANEAPVVDESDPSQVPSWGSEDESNHKLEIEFKDSEGNNKRLKIDY